jgi:predicted N-acetyltransferase YhbS
MSIIIRPESTADHEAIRHVNRLAFNQDDEARLVDALRQGSFVRVSLVAERAGQVVGHILFSDLPILSDSGRALGFTQLYPSFSSVSMRPIRILNDLYVAEAARGRGVRARLLRAVRDHATKSGAVRLALSTAVTNTKAQALYERDGWRRDTAFLHYDHELPKGGQ